MAKEKQTVNRQEENQAYARVEPVSIRLAEVKQ